MTPRRKSEPRMASQCDQLATIYGLVYCLDDGINSQSSRKLTFRWWCLL